MKMIGGQPRLGNNRMTWWVHVKRHTCRERWRRFWFGDMPPGEDRTTMDWCGYTGSPEWDFMVGVHGGKWVRERRGWEFYRA